MKKYFILYLIAAFTFLTSYAQNADSAWFRANYYKIERQIPMRDGKKLFTALYVPKDTSVTHPILFNRTPYSCYPYGEDKINARLYDSYWINYLKRKMAQEELVHLKLWFVMRLLKI